MKVYYNTDYTASEYAFDTTRKSAEIANYITNVTRIRELEVEDPSYAYQLTEKLINKMHSAEYVKAVKTGSPTNLAESQGFEWDESIYTMALAHNAGLVAATQHVLYNNNKVAGSLSSGLHHSSKDNGVGFCTFNGIAIAAQAAHEYGAKRILSLDFDAHCGGGTYSMTRDIGVVQVDVICSMFDDYDITDDESRYFLAHEELSYDNLIKTALDYSTTLGPWDFVIYNAGMDPYNCGVTFQELARREEAVAQWAKANNYPIIFALAGGYTWGNVTMKDLVDLHTLTVRSFAEVFSADPN